MFHLPVLRVVIPWIFCCGFLAAQGSVRMVVLRLPSTDAAAVTTQLTGAKEEAMVPVLKRKGITALADETKANPWAGGTQVVKKGTEGGGGSAPDQGVEIEFEPTEAGNQIHTRVSATISMPATGKGYRSMQYLAAEVLRKGEPGKWRELARWNDGKEAVMLWNFAVTGEAGAAETNPKEMKNVRMEILFFKAEDADIATLGKATAETSEKAFRWISQRAPLFREAAFVARSRDRMVWADTDGVMEEKNGAAAADEARIAFEVGFSGDRTALKTTCQVITREHGGKDKEPLELKAPSTIGTWEFIPLEGVEGANVAAMRLSWP